MQGGLNLDIVNRLFVHDLLSWALSSYSVAEAVCSNGQDLNVLNESNRQEAKL